jgi:hypothetical protein
MTAHRYWRLNVPPLGGYSIDIAELQLRTAIGGVSVASGGVASGGAIIAGVAANAFDGSTATTCVMNNVGGWLAYDFGAGNAQDIVEIAITVGATTTAVIGGSLEYSDDAVSWFPRLAFAGQMGPGGVGPWPPSSTRVFAALWDAPGNARAVSTPAPSMVMARPPIEQHITASTRLVVPRGLIDALDGGTYRISGTLKTKGTPDAPVMRRVYLFDHASWRVVRDQWSDPATGAYSFDWIRMGKFFVVAFDYLQDYRAVIADNLTPEPMP